MLEGCLSGAGLSFAAVPSVSALMFSHATFKRLLQNYLGIVGHPLPHSHHCGSGHAQQLDRDSSHHAHIFTMLGRSKGAHGEFMGTLAHATKKSCEIATGMRTEVRISARGVEGSAISYDAEVAYFDLVVRSDKQVFGL
jgi:hypothetical protein